MGSIDAGGTRPDARFGWLLLVILVVGLGLRLIGLGSSFWIDEVDAVLHSFRLPVGTLVTSYASENHHPLYSLLAHLSIGAFGEHEWSARLPAVLLGVASLAAVARLGRQVLNGTTGLLAALLLAVAYHHVWFSQNARGYTGLLLFTVLATSELLELLTRPTPRMNGAAWRYALWFALALYSHLTAAFAFAGHGLVWLALRWRPAWIEPARSTPLVDCGPLPAPRASIAALAGGALLALLAYAPMLDDVVGAFSARAQQSAVAVVKVEPWTKPGWALGQLAASFGENATAMIGLAAAGILAAVGLGSLWRNCRRTFVLLHLLPVPLALALLLGMGRHLYPRFFFFEAGFAAIALVRGARISGGWIACNLPGCKSARGERWGIAVSLLVAAASCLSLTRLYELPKQDFTGARDFIEASAAPGDARVGVGSAALALPEYYAASLPGWAGVRADKSIQDAIAADADAAERFAAIRAAAPRTWVVVTLREQLRAALPTLAAVLDRDFDVARELPGSLSGGAVFVLVSRR